MREDEAGEAVRASSADSRGRVSSRTGRARSGSSRRDARRSLSGSSAAPGGASVDRAPRATPVSGCSRPLGELLDRMAVAIARREVHQRVRARTDPPRRICSTRLTRSKNSGQSIDDSSRMLVITLPIASWSAASR